ncbi:hypothetical protein KZZ52_35570 [Dactylosporangium sp. AC04546]|uniref:hypothetical protein n=1 Tax=Dactylosporangium sp. AC04546 TaxID=2862460 RepID=UPI001EDF45E5|nr:hypothetical protein [Dactylosporangium sp. AC04546]WVK79291.1 hypothetical protein KZZ52_35570 [Dactylosporangium sp. AC04546]
MTHSRILAHLARRFTVSEENLATEALTYLLHAAPSARDAMNDIARVLGCELPRDLRYAGQVGADGLGRPDIVGIDAAARERLIVEAKFGAGLTEQQPGGYLARLADDVAGMVLVVAPSVRLPSLWRELLTALALSRQSDDGDVRSVQVGPRTTLALVSWREVVTRVRDALRAANERDLVEDAEQLLALTEVMDSAAYLPPRLDELGQRTGQLIHQLQYLMDRVRIELDPAIATPVSKSVAMDYAGWYVTSPTGAQAWFGILPRAWAKFGFSPLWAQVGPRWSGLNRVRIQQALGGLNETGRAGLFEEEGFLTPLIIPPNVSESAAVAQLCAQLEDFVMRLGAASPGMGPSVTDDIV